MAMTSFVVLLRAVNVGGRTLPMAELRMALQAGGFADCRTFIASGNLLLTADRTAPEVEARVEELIAAGFGLTVPAIARDAATFARLAAASPFPDASPKLLHLALAKRPFAPGAAPALAARATAGERVAQVGEALWIDFGESGVARSKLTPAAIDRAAGSPVTARNANTAAKLVALAGA